MYKWYLLNFQDFCPPSSLSNLLNLLSFHEIICYNLRMGIMSAWSIQTEQFVAWWATFVPEFFQLFHFRTGESILFNPEGQLSVKENLLTSKLDGSGGFRCVWHSSWTICSLMSHMCSGIFPTFSLSYLGAQSYYPGWPIIRTDYSANLRFGWIRGVSVSGQKIFAANGHHRKTCIVGCQ